MVRHHVTAALLAVAAGLGGDAGPRRPAMQIEPALDASALRSGDLIFRAGRGWRADVVRLLSRDALSHVGIVDVAADGVHVIHAAPPGDGDPGGTVRTTLAAFGSVNAASGVVAYRRTDLDAGALAAIVNAARRFARSRIPFDDAFDLADARAVYCTELVVRASAMAGAPLAARTTRIGSGLLAGTYLMPRDLLAKERFALVGPQADR